MDEEIATTVDVSALPDGLILRPLYLEDAAALHALLQLPAVAYGNAQPPFQTEAYTHAFIEKAAPNDIAIVACIGETLVGQAELTPGKGRRAHTGSIGICVHDAWHRHGIGHALMRELLDLADNWLGLRRVELQVFADNHAALALYRKCGFEIEARQRGVMLRDGVLIDGYLMARLHEPAPLAPLQTSPDTPTIR